MIWRKGWVELTWCWRSLLSLNAACGRGSRHSLFHMGRAPLCLRLWHREGYVDKPHIFSFLDWFVKTLVWGWSPEEEEEQRKDFQQWLFLRLRRILGWWLCLSFLKCPLTCWSSLTLNCPAWHVCWHSTWAFCHSLPPPVRFHLTMTQWHGTCEEAARGNILGRASCSLGLEMRWGLRGVSAIGQRGLFGGHIWMHCHLSFNQGKGRRT